MKHGILKILSISISIRTYQDLKLLTPVHTRLSNNTLFHKIAGSIDKIQYSRKTVSPEVQASRRFNFPRCAYQAGHKKKPYIITEMKDQFPFQDRPFTWQSSSIRPRLRKRPCTLSPSRFCLQRGAARRRLRPGLISSVESPGRF